MNVQTERLENQIARLTVQIEPARFDAAKQQAARKIGQRINIPGFRKGKVPYRYLVQFVGEESIVEQAIELIFNDIYK